MPWRGEAPSPECDPGGHPADSAAGQSGICPLASSSRFDPRVLPSRRSQGEATYLKLNNRFENTAPVSLQETIDFGFVGPIARASGLAIDVRNDHPQGIWRFTHIPVAISGDGAV